MSIGLFTVLLHCTNEFKWLMSFFKKSFIGCIASVNNDSACTVTSFFYENRRIKTSGILNDERYFIDANPINQRVIRRLNILN